MWEDTAGAWASLVGVGAAAAIVRAPGGDLPATASPLQGPAVAVTGGRPPLAGGCGQDCPSRGQVWHPALSSPPGLRQDGGTPRLLPGRPRAPGRAEPRSLLTGPAEVGVAGLQRAPLLQEREYLPTPSSSQTLDCEGAQETGGQRACLTSADRKRCLAGPGRADPGGWVSRSLPQVPLSFELHGPLAYSLTIY